MKKKQSPVQRLAFNKGYRVGVERQAAMIAALKEDRDYWKLRYSKLRDAVGMAPLSDEEK